MNKKVEPLKVQNSVNISQIPFAKKQSFEKDDH